MSVILIIGLLITGCTSWLFYWVPQNEYNHQANAWLGTVMFALVPFAWFRFNQAWVAHCMMASIVVCMVYISIYTGGINSSVVVWIVVSFIASLLFLGPKVTLFWIAISVLAQAGLWFAGTQGLIDSHVEQSNQTLPWTLMNHMGALVTLMVGLRFFDHMHEKRLQEVRQRNDELLQLHRSLQAAQAHKDEFVAAIGHELRTPMNAILGLNGVLKNEFSDHPESAETAEHIRQSTQRLLSLVNDILDYSQLQAGKVSFQVESCLLPDWFEALAEKYEPIAKRQGLTFTWKVEPSVVRLDAYRLTQVLDQLLNNAFKFTDQGGVDVRVWHESYYLRVEVRDTGRGVPAERQRDVFNRFEHADQQTNRVYGGAGLGLAICEQLLTLQKGRIGVVSETDQGALFWVELPCALLERSAQMQSVAHTSGRLLKPVLLIVDDNPVNLMVAKLQILKHFAHAQLTTATSGTEALTLFEEQVFDLALLDMVMPDMDGLALAQHIRTSGKAWAQTPLLALTANKNPVDQQRCLEAGMQAVLHKPMDDFQVKKVLTHWLSQPLSGSSS